jgi:hypothetical protein
MAFTVPKATKAPTVQRTSNSNWLKGTVTAYDSGRTPVDGLTSASNVILDQDGTVRPRPSLRLYGPQPIGTVLGEIFEFKAQSGLVSTMWMISLQNVAGVTNAYIAKGEDTTWTLCSGKTYSNTGLGHFVQIQDKVIIMNGVDSLSYLNISTSTIVAYTALTTPAAPTLTTNTGLTGTAYKVYYAVTANSTVGETAGSAALSQPVLTDRDMWNPATQSIQISWTTVANVKSWNVYMGTSADGAGVPTMYAIATGLDATILSFTDDGSRAQDLSRPLPTNNSTAGPKASRGSIINGRPWLVGDADNPFWVWRGGDFGFELDFSPSNGGGYSPVGNGSKEVPVKVVSYRSGKGDPVVTVLTQGSNGSGKRYILSPTSITYGASTFVVWQVQEDSGNDGTDSPDAVISYQNDLHYPSRDGFKTTGTQPQLQNVLSTRRTSNTIQTDISRLNTLKMPLAVGNAYEGKLRFALPVGNNTNNEIWVLDLDRGGAWMKPWNISADWMWLYNDNSGVTHDLILQDNKIYELTNSQMTNDNGVAFLTSGNSGLIKFSEDGREWGKLIKVIFTILRPQGALAFTVTALTDEGVITYTDGDNYGMDTSVAGWGEPSRKGLLGFGRHAWSQVEAVPQASGVASTDIEVEVDEEAQWWTYGWSSSGVGANYQISAVTAEFVPVGLKDAN